MYRLQCCLLAVLKVLLPVKVRLLFKASIPPPCIAELFVKILFPVKFRVLSLRLIPPPNFLAEFFIKRQFPVYIKELSVASIWSTISKAYKLINVDAISLSRSLYK